MANETSQNTLPTELGIGVLHQAIGVHVALTTVVLTSLKACLNDSSSVHPLFSNTYKLTPIQSLHQSSNNFISPLIGLLTFL